MASDKSWAKILKTYNVLEHDFSKEPFEITAEQIKKAVQNFTKTNEKEVRILCKQDTREQRPEIFRDNNLFLLPIKNGTYNLVQGEGYVDIPELTQEPEVYEPKLEFKLETSLVGDSEMQHLDFAYAASLIRTFTQDPSLVLTIRGRKYTPEFSFKVNSQEITVSGVQTEVDAGYEGSKQVVLIEAKNGKSRNTIIRQMFYPLRQWAHHTDKEVKTLFFEKEKNANIYSIWQFKFDDINDYNSIELEKSGRFLVQ